MILPVVVFAVALYAFFLRLGLSGTIIGFVIAHLVLALPFSIISITNALEGFDKSIEDAAVALRRQPAGGEAADHPAVDQPSACFRRADLLLPHLLG